MKSLKALALLALTLAALVAIQAVAQTPEVKDPAEYNAYMSALGMTNPSQKASAMEGFLQQYPNTVLKKDALQQLMIAYQQSGNGAKTTETATKLVQADPANVTGLYVLADTARNKVEAGDTSQAASARQYGEQGLKALDSFAKPAGVSEADFKKAKDQLSIAFNGAAGRGALATKDFPAAQKYFLASVNTNSENLRDVYALAVAYLSQRPIPVQGLWYIARATALSKGTKDNAQIADYGKKSYYVYHGDNDGWDDLVAKAAASAAMPSDLDKTIKPAPTPAEQAAKIASKDPKELSFDDLQTIITYGDPATVEKVMTEVKAAPIPYKALVISADKTKLVMAATYDGVQNKTADMDVTMAAPIPPALMPKVGEQIGIQATVGSYDKSPYMLHMVDGKLVRAKAPAPVHHPVHRKAN